LRIGDDSANGTPFFTDMINFMQLKYMYSSEWFSMTEFLMINVEIPCECIKVMQILRFPTVMKLQARKVRKHSHPNPKHHDFLQVRACT
jgi:cytochrome c biogenesis protein ResB